VTPFRPPVPGTQPDNDSPQYGSTARRHPKQPLIRLPHTITEVTGPSFSPTQFPEIADLTGPGALGERIIVRGRVTDEDGRAVPNTIVEVWQANAAGRYDHPGDTHDAPLDPAFHGEGRVFTDADGYYQFVSIKPGPYPWGNHHKAWRPAHIHFFVTADGHRKLTTQINIDGDPLIYDDFAYATREGLVPALVERTDAASLQAQGLSAPFAEIVFDIRLSALVQGVDNQIVERPRLAVFRSNNHIYAQVRKEKKREREGGRETGLIKTAPHVTPLSPPPHLSVRSSTTPRATPSCPRPP
jgi:protocatechuate 3,4-dioxygenase beta subunit